MLFRSLSFNRPEPGDLVSEGTLCTPSCYLFLSLGITMMPDTHHGLQPQPPYRPAIPSSEIYDDQISLLLARLGLNPHSNGNTYRVITYDYDPEFPAIKAAKD